MELFIKIAQLVLSLAILVVFHEFGHFTFAKLFKTRVEKFYLFFNPWFSLFKFKKGETEYGIGWLPIGGYVKIAGMIDESMDKEQMKQPPQPWEFRSKPAWQRLFIMLGGVMVNFILAAVIYIGILFVWGEDYLPTENVKYGIIPDSTAMQIGFKDGDKIITVGDKKVENFRSVVPEILLNYPLDVKVNRNGKLIEIPIRNENIKGIINSSTGLFSLRLPFVIDTVQGKQNSNAGLRKGDRFVAVNDSSMLFFDEYKEYLKKHKGSNITVTVLRNNDSVKIPLKVNENGLLGVKIDPMKDFEFKHIDYGFFGAIPAGIGKGFKQAGDYLKQFKLIFKPSTGAYKKVGSLGTILKVVNPTWDWQSFWALTAFLSVILGVVNLLPIPALDGGHVMFVLYEMISGRKPSEKFLEYAQIFGFVILLAIMIFAVRNDIINW